MINQSFRPIKEIKELQTSEEVGEYDILFPENMATDIDPKTKKKIFCISINNQKKCFFVGEIINLTYSEWELLQNIGNCLPRRLEYDPLEEYGNK